MIKIILISIFFLYGCASDKIVLQKKINDFNFNEAAETISAATTDESVVKIIKIYKDDFGYVNIEGQVPVGVKELILNNEPVENEKFPKFQRRLIMRLNKKFVFKAKFENGSSKSTEFEDNDAPASPEGIELTSVMQNRISIRWNENSEKDLYGYNLYIYNEKNGWKKFNREDEIIKKTEFTFNNLHSGNNYKIKISAFDFLRNESNFSNELEVKTPGVYQNCCE